MKRYIKLLIVLFIASLNFNLILKPLKLVTGGTQGLGLVISNIINIDVSIIILVVNMLMLLISYIFLSKSTTVGTIISTFIYPLMVKMTDSIVLFDDFNVFLVLVSGVLCGITGGLIFKLGFSAGGIGVLPLIMDKFFHIRISVSNFFINFVIIILSCGEFGFVKSFFLFVLF